MQCACNVKTNDQVEVIAGKDKGRVGKVLRVDRGNRRAVVEKINMIKRHTKPNQVRQRKTQYKMTLHLSTHSYLRHHL